MLYKINKFLEKIMPAITPTSVILGVLLTTWIKDYSFLIPWIFAFMTFSGSLGSTFKSLKNVVTHPFRIVIVLLLLHVIMPLWALSVGHIIFPHDSFTITGLVLAMVIPTGITSVIWVSIYRGNLPLTLALILIDTMLSPFLVPFSLSILVGQKVHMDPLGMMEGLLWMIVLPSLAGMTLNYFTKGKVQPVLGTKLAPFSKIGLACVVMLNGSVIAPYFKHIDSKLVLMAVVVFFIACSGYFFAFLSGLLLKQDRENTVSFIYTAGMRNISAGAVLAVSYFPAKVAVPVIIGMLFQQILASLYGVVITRYYRGKDREQQVA